MVSAGPLEVLLMEFAGEGLPDGVRRLANGSPIRVRLVMSDGRSVRGHEQGLEQPSRVAFMGTATRHPRPQRAGLPALRQVHQYRRQMVQRSPQP
jgi:hypothetical protein